MSFFQHRNALRWPFVALVLVLSTTQANTLPAAETTGQAQSSLLNVAFRPHAQVQVKIDGQLDEAIWQTLPYTDDFVVLDPDTLKPSSMANRVRLFNTERGLYVSVDMEQPPNTHYLRYSGRDLRNINRDNINITIDTSGEGRYGFWFGINLGNSLMDGTVLPERKFSNEWDGAWRGASTITPHGWSAEFFIPWSTVSMPASDGSRQMGIYLSRKVAHLNERWGWPTLPGTSAKFMSALQKIQLNNVSPKPQYSLYPFVSTTIDEIDSATSYRAGADVFWRPSSNLQLDATINPDFGGVESDNVVINLSATEVFFPEKRLFFTEGQQIFIASPRADTRSNSVGNAGTPYTMVNTRRIGGRARAPELPTGVTVENRELIAPTELVGAVKATGQLGRLRYGLLGASEKDQKFDAQSPAGELNLHQDGSDYGIARLLYEDNKGGAYRAAGLLSTAVTHTQSDAYAHGLDLHYLSKTGGFGFDAQLFMSELEGAENGAGGFADFVWTPRRGIRSSVGLEYLDEHVDINDLGFLARNDQARIRASHTRTSSNMTWARSNQFDIRGFVGRNTQGDFIGGGLFLSNRIITNSNGRMTVRVGHSPSNIDDLNSFGNGLYRVRARSSASIAYDTSSTRDWIVGASLSLSEEFLGSNSWTYAASFVWRPGSRFSSRLNLSYAKRRDWLLHQEAANFTTFNAEQWQPSFTLEYFANAQHQLRLSLQWVGIKAQERKFYRIPSNPGNLIRDAKPSGPSDDFAISDMVLQLRYRWELAPLSDLFVVYTRGSDLTLTATNPQFGDESFEDLASNAWNEPIANLWVVKLRYRFGS